MPAPDEDGRRRPMRRAWILITAMVLITLAGFATMFIGTVVDSYALIMIGLATPMVGVACGAIAMFGLRDVVRQQDD